MSAMPRLTTAPPPASVGVGHDAPPAERLPVTLPQLAEHKRLGEPIAMITAYDYPSAQVAEAATPPNGTNSPSSDGGVPAARGRRGME